MTKITGNQIRQQFLNETLRVLNNQEESNTSVWNQYKNAAEKSKKSVTENYSYTSQSGITYTGKLTVLKNGTCYFESNLQNGIPFLIQFKSEKDLKNNKVHQQINYPNDDKKRTTMTYNYNILGKKSSIKTTNAEGKLIGKTKFNNHGKIAKEEIYDPKTGEIKQTVKHEYDKKAHTETRKVYDKDNNLKSTVFIQYADDDKTIQNSTITTQDGKKITRDYTDEKYIKTQEFQNDKLTSESVVWKDTNVIKDKWEMINGEKVHTISSEVDLDFKPSKQIGQGDCYLLSVINSMIGAEGGKEALQKLIDIKENNGNKVYKVTLPGALKLKEGLKNDKNVDPQKAYVTGTYEFTQEEFDEILKKAGKRYSIGNANVILLEAAFEKFREEVLKTMKANNITKIDKTIAGQNMQLNEENILYNGLTYDAIYMLTGQQSYVYMNSGKEYALSLEDLQNGKFTLVNKKQPDLISKAAPSEVVDGVAHTDAQLDEFINKIKEDYKDGNIDYIVAVGFGTINSKGKKGGHALTVVGIDDTSITLVNPWHPDKKVKMSLEDFKKAVSQISISEKPAKISASEQTVNQNDNNSVIPDNPQNPEPVDPVEPTSPTSLPDGARKVKIPLGKGYTAFIKEQLAAQGHTNPTREQITKAKQQFEAANPKKNGNQAYVHVYSGPETEFAKKGNKYLIADLEYIVPVFNLS